MRRRVLIHGEDPGAMNFLIGLPAELAQFEIETTFVADGAARSYLAERDVTVPLPELTDPPDTFLRRRRIELVIAGTSANAGSRAFELIAAARRCEIPSAAVVDAPVNAASRFSGGGTDPLAYAPDWILVPDDATKRALVEIGAPAARVLLVDNPRRRELAAMRATLEPRGKESLRAQLFRDAGARRTIVFVSEPPPAFAPDPAAAAVRTSRALDALLEAVEGETPRPFVVLRYHPRENERYRPDGIDAISQGGDPASLLFAADLVVGMTSMALQEAVMLGTPALAILSQAAEREWLPMIADGRLRAFVLDDGGPESLAALVRKAAATVPPPQVNSPVLGEISVAEVVRNLLRGAGASQP